jgi:cytochrome c oxidase subunit 3
MMSQTLNTRSTEEMNREQVFHPKKFLLWLLIVASVMLFAAFTSAYIVKRGDGNWRIFDLPAMFAYNTIVAIIGSLFMQLAYRAAKRDELSKLKTQLFLALVVGIVFMVCQYAGWKQLVADNVYLAGSASESFVYVISAVHFIHMIIAVGFVSVVIFKAYRFQVHKKNMLSIHLCTTFYHFVGLMWIYLYFFFLLNR